MENIPPSYEAAIARNPWQIIAPYIPSVELCALNRVDHRLHQVFAPYLWGDPASHFGTENDRVYVALTRFKGCLGRVRLYVRKLTHTLHLPPAQPELYDGPYPKWLRDILEQLPNLQSLVVSQLPFFDHLALLTLRSYSNGRQLSPEESMPTYSLRLLIASRCQNATSQGLAEALEHFQHLAYLDLSGTLAARDKSVLSRLRKLPLLQILKLRSVHLRDEDVEFLAEAIGIRVRTLDVQGNHLTDHSVRILLNFCFQDEDAADGLSNDRLHTSPNLIVDDGHSGLVKPDSEVLDEFRDESYDERFVRGLTSCNITRLPYEDMPYSGITHLYIADNNLTVEGLASLVRSRKLHVLDAGSLNDGTISNKPQSSFSTGTLQPHDDSRFRRIPGIEQLTPVLGEYAETMTSLRLHHAIVTENAPAMVREPLTTYELRSEDTARQGLNMGISPYPAEVDAAAYEKDETPPLYELEPREPIPRLELPGNCFHTLANPPTGKKPSVTCEQSQLQTQRAGAFASGVIEPASDDDNVAPVLTATTLSTMAQAVNGIAITSSAMSALERTAAIGLIHDKANLQLALIEKQRRKSRADRLDEPHGLIPGMVANLRTLTLTDVPSYVKSPRIVEALIDFIKDCASETELATVQARREPRKLRRPGERAYKPHHHSAREAFALRHIVLEMAPAEVPLPSQSAPTQDFSRKTKSSTEDADSEALWSAAENDFTFFSNDEKCGLPSIGTDSYVPYPAVSEKIMISTGGSQIDKLPTLHSPPSQEVRIDVVHELAKFRKDRKTAHENAVKKGLQHVDGYWPGEVKIVRGHHSGGKIGFYGNHIEKTGV